jgi:hypothetical protein
MEHAEEDLAEITIKNKELQDKCVKEIEIFKVKETVNNALKSMSRPINFLEFPDNTVVKVVAYKFVQTRYGESVVLVYIATEGLGLVWAQYNIKNHLTKVRELAANRKLDVTNLYGTYNIKKPILFLKKTGFYWTKDTNTKVANVEILGVVKNDGELDAKPTNSLVKLPESIKIKNAAELDKLVEENDKITVLGYRKLEKGMLLNIRKEVEGIPELLVKTSYWIIDLVEKNKLFDKGSVFTVIAGPYKTTPTKKKSRLFCI